MRDNVTEINAISLDQVALKYRKSVDEDLEYQMKLFQQLGRSLLYKISSRTKHN